MGAQARPPSERTCLRVAGLEEGRGGRGNSRDGGRVEFFGEAVEDVLSFWLDNALLWFFLVFLGLKTDTIDIVLALRALLLQT